MTTFKTMPAFAASLVLHVGVFALVSYLAMKPSILAPIGVYKKGGPVVVEIGVNSPVAATTKSVSRPHLSEQGDVSVAKKKESKVQPQAPASSVAKTELGHLDGTATGGRLGDPNGKAAGEKERYLYELHVLIEGRKVYPVMSRRLREAGKVLVQFTVEKDGTIKDVSVKEGTSFARLNEAARALIAGIKKYKPLPADFTDSDVKLEIPIEYTLQ